MDKKKWEQENVLRLVKKSRKGVLRVVFSRFGLMALLLILELVLLWMMWRWFNNDFEWFAAVQGVFTVLMFFHLFNSDMDATGKLTWMFLLAVIPIPEVGVFDEVLTACVIGGLLCGAGAGLTLTAGCSGGGEEILGLLCAMKNPWFSVGRISMLLNIGVFGTGLFLFDRQSVVYSILMAGVMYLCLDRVHLQNVMVAMFIITKREDMEKLVFQRAGRGVTRWVGEGAYSSQETDILLTVVSKKEALSLRRALQERDPNVFAIICEDISVVGNFQKRV